MWLPLTSRSLRCFGIFATSPRKLAAHGPVALTSARASIVRSVAAFAAKMREPDVGAALDARAARARRDLRATRGGILRDQHDEARVVGPGVGIDEALLELRLQRRARGVRAEVDATRMDQRVRAPAAEVVVEQQRGADHPLRSQMRLVRQHEAQRPHDVRRRTQHDFALRERLADEREFVLLEIAQAAVDQLAARTRRVRREVVLLAQQHRQAAPGRIARDRRAVDAAADDENIDLIARFRRRHRVFRQPRSDSHHTQTCAPCGSRNRA